MDFKKHKRKGALSELIQVQEFFSQGGDITQVSVSGPDQELLKTNPDAFNQGFIARNPDNHNDMWYISKEYYDKNLEEVEEPKQETFLDRLQKERDELSDKHVKLEAFISNKEKAIQISGQAQYDLLMKQSHFMNEYLNILDHRLLLLQID
jgi:hypothetical protein